MAGNDVAVPELALDGGEVAGLAHDALAHGLAGGVRGLAGALLH
jgi:hypothetical protein